jgi:beta-galactosidase
MSLDFEEPPRRVSYDERAILIDGRRELLISGEVHYARVPEKDWERVLDATKAAGLNCVATYVFWNLHEDKRDRYDFGDGKDLSRFLGLCGDRGLYVILRAGPYCCAEWNYGGFPSWLRDEPGIVLRTWNTPYLRRVEKYLRHLFAETRRSLATRGGPVIMVQLENEYANIAKRYGKDGGRYLAWFIKLAREQGIDVPVVMCEGGARGALEAFNGFSISNVQIADFRKKQAGLPLMWTELWTGWYDTWGCEHHLRDARNVAYHILRFLAAGGAAWNYYMWHGGTNFGRTSMYLQAHSYDFDAPLDEWGRVTRKGAYLSLLHQVLEEKKGPLLNGRRVESPSGVVWADGGNELRLDWDEKGRRGVLSGERGKVLFDTEGAWRELGKARRHASPWRPLEHCRNWRWMPEPLPSSRSDPGTLNASPQDQLLWTRDETDYCWYSHTLEGKRAGKHELYLPFCGDFLRVYINGKPVAQTSPSLKECRGPTDAAPDPGSVNPLELAKSEYAQTFQVPLRTGRNQVDVLCSALGLIKGDWMISGPMTGERKGIWSNPYLDNEPLRGWRMRAGLEGYSSKGRSRRRSKFLGWCQTEFSVSRRMLDGSHDFRLDLMGWEKGMIFVNGRLLGRFWLIESHGYGPDESWHQKEKHGLAIEGAGKPTQRYYRIPHCWLKEKNSLRILEEGRAPLLVKIESRRAR